MPKTELAVRIYSEVISEDIPTVALGELFPTAKRFENLFHIFLQLSGLIRRRLGREKITKRYNLRRSFHSLCKLSAH
jgi:hypothetical protein